MHFLAETLVELLGIPENYAEHGGSVDHLIDVVHWFMLALFVGWTGFFLLACWKFWQRRSPKAASKQWTDTLTSTLYCNAIYEYPRFRMAPPSWKPEIRLSGRRRCPEQTTGG